MFKKHYVPAIPIQYLAGSLAIICLNMPNCEDSPSVCYWKLKWIFFLRC